MPSWWIGGGSANPFSIALAVNYQAPMGEQFQGPTEVNVQVMARDTYTWSRLFVRVTQNSYDQAFTQRSRINAGFGNQTVTVGAGLTGTWADDTNSDALVDGDLFCWEKNPTTSTVGTIRVWACSVLFSGTNVPIQSCGGTGVTVAGGVTQYFAIGGESAGPTTETTRQYTFRTAATLTNLKTYVSANTAAAATTFRTRVNAGPGNQNFTIGAGLTGTFEDAVNSDAIAVGDEVCTEVAVGAGAGSVYCRTVQYKSASVGRRLVTCDGDTNLTLTFGLTRYQASEGQFTSTLQVESNTQVEARFAWRLANLLANIVTNTLDGATVVTVRVNAGASAVALTIGAGLTGIFENTTNAITLVATDSHNVEIVTAGGAGSIVVGMVGRELLQIPSAGSIVPLAVGAGII